MKDTVPELRLDLIGPGGRLSLDVEGMRVITVSNDDLRTKPTVTRIERVSPSWTVAGIEAALRELISSVETGRPPASPPESARQTVAITQAILDSQAAGNRPVRVARPAAPSRPGGTVDS